MLGSARHAGTGGGSRRKVFSMVGEVKQGGGVSGLLHGGHDAVEHGVGVDDCVVVCVDESRPVSDRGFGGSFRPEYGIWSAVSFLVVEMRAICVQDDEQFPAGQAVELVSEVSAQFHVLMPEFVVGEEMGVVGTASEEVDQRAIALLV